MGGFSGAFRSDSKLFYYLTKLAEVLWLNILVLLCSIPLLTIGAAMTALHYCLLKIYRDESLHVTRDFFRQLWANLLPATLEWLIMLASLGACIGVFFLLRTYATGTDLIEYVLLALALVLLLIFLWVFPLQSRYENTIFNMFKNAFVIFVSHLLQSVFMLVLHLLPLLLLLNIELWPIVALFGVSLPGIGNTMFYTRVFNELEGKVTKKVKAINDLSGPLSEEEAAELQREDEEPTNEQAEEEI